ncbi:MAG: bis(5'-nucleosyl)-tetraphosphatase (symmetrical) YqeK [Rectinema sp.]|nr:bis(5'-nucleosyl)-tetraphosphatase (symmetrical) YqeK [Rectinema sp.]
MDYINSAEVISAIEKMLRAEMSEKRFLHCLSTADTAAFLCARYGLDPMKGRLAGLTHDMARELPFPQQEAIFLEYQACLGALASRASLKAIQEDEEFHKKMLHGPAAACILCSRYRIHDRDILESIALHSIADEEMSPLARVVYIADKLEPHRKRPTDAERQLQVLDLDSLFSYTVHCVVRWFEESGKPLSPFTQSLFRRMSAS